MEPIRKTIDDSTKYCMSNNIMQRSGVWSIPLIRCDDQGFKDAEIINGIIKQENIVNQIVNGQIKEEYIDNTDIQSLQNRNETEEKRNTIDSNIKTEMDVLDDVKFEGTAIERNSSELVGRMNWNLSSNLFMRNETEEKRNTIDSNIKTEMDVLDDVKFEGTAIERNSSELVDRMNWNLSSNLFMRNETEEKRNTIDSNIKTEMDVLDDVKFEGTAIERNSSELVDRMNWNLSSNLFMRNETEEKRNTIDSNIKTEMDVLDDVKFEGTAIERNSSELVDRMNWNLSSNLFMRNETEEKRNTIDSNIKTEMDVLDDVKFEGTAIERNSSELVDRMNWNLSSNLFMRNETEEKRNTIDSNIKTEMDVLDDVKFEGTAIERNSSELVDRMNWNLSSNLFMRNETEEKRNTIDSNIKTEMDVLDDVKFEGTAIERNSSELVDRMNWNLSSNLFMRNETEEKRNTIDSNIKTEMDVLDDVKFEGTAIERNSSELVDRMNWNLSSNLFMRNETEEKRNTIDSNIKTEMDVLDDVKFEGTAIERNSSELVDRMNWNLSSNLFMRNETEEKRNTIDSNIKTEMDVLDDVKFEGTAIERNSSELVDRMNWNLSSNLFMRNETEEKRNTIDSNIKTEMDVLDDVKFEGTAIERNSSELVDRMNWNLSSNLFMRNETEEKRNTIDSNIKTEMDVLDDVKFEGTAIERNSSELVDRMNWNLSSNLFMRNETEEKRNTIDSNIKTEMDVLDDVKFEGTAIERNSSELVGRMNSDLTSNCLMEEPMTGNGDKTSTASNVIVHSKKNTRKEPYKCSVCDKSFFKKQNLISHIMKHTGDYKHKCDTCDKRFATTYHFIVHSRMHTGEKPFKCDICDKAFSRTISLKVHKSRHIGERPFKCDICDKAFYLTYDLKVHKSRHRGDKPFKCDICDKAFLQAFQVTRHKRTHTGEKPYTCDICDKSFSTTNCLNVHKRRHRGEKPFKCDICDKAFYLTNDLKVHKSSHRGEKPFKCDICDKAFLHVFLLKRHKRTHTGVKPYTCDTCDKAFLQGYHLTRHKRTHNGEKPYTCDTCDRAFSLSGNLTKHKRTHSR